MVRGVRTVENIEVYIADTGFLRSFIYIALKTNDGVVGLGEASQGGSDASVIAQLSEMIFQIKDLAIEQALQRLRTWGRAPVLDRSQSVARSGLEIAAWDALARTLGVPLNVLFGGAPEPLHLPQYATLWSGIKSWDPERLAAEADLAIDRGYLGVKIVPFADVSSDEIRVGRAVAATPWARLEAVRAAIGPERLLMVECAFSFGIAEARGVVARLEQYRPFWIEAPLLWDDPLELRNLRRQTAIPIASGEMVVGTRQARTLLEAGAIDILMPDVKWCGGLSEIRVIASMADAYQVGVALHNNSGAIATRATAHVAATMSNLIVMERPLHSPPWEDEVFDVDASRPLTAEELLRGSGLALEMDSSHPALQRVI